MKKVLSVFVVLTMLFSVAVLAQVELTDGMNRSVTIDNPPEKIISLTPSNTEILFALGVGDKLIGVDAYSNYPPEAAEVANIVGDYAGPNLELIVSLEPDIVFASTKLQSDDIAQMESLGLTVVCVEPTKYQDIVSSVQLVADAMGIDGAPLIDEMKAKEAAALEGVDASNPKKVYFALSFGEYGNWTAGPDTFIDEMITMAGGTNVAGSALVSWPEYSMEQLIIDDPDVIIVSAPGADESVVQQLKEAEGFRDLRAVRENRVFAVDADESNRPGPRIVNALEAFVNAING